MTKKQVEELVDQIRRKKTSSLEEIKSDLHQIIQERELTKQMYWWKPSTSAGGRRSNERKRNIVLEVEVTKAYAIKYKRDYEESCHYVYASDVLVDSYKVKLTVADLKKIIAGIETILSKRASSEPEA